MRGLRTQEGLKFERFFSLIQSAAAGRGCVFFADAGDGNDFSTQEMDGENLMGWLIPQQEADEFEPFFLNNEDIPERWKEAFCWAEWENPSNPKIRFAFYG